MNVNNLSQYDCIIISAYAPGGANQIFSLLKLNSELLSKCVYIVEGPARSIFKPFLTEENSTSVADLSKLQGKNTIAITGLSGNHSLELEVIKSAQKFAWPSISILEHWANYAMRFQLNGYTIHPDFIWVTDSEAMELAKIEGLPQNRLVLVDNYYLTDMKAQYELGKKASHSKTLHKRNILYICEYLDVLNPNPQRNSKIKEVEILKSLIELIDSNGFSDKFNLILRLHPYENIDKYDAIIEGHKNISKSGGDLISDLIKADLVVGVNSMALYIAAKLGIKSYSMNGNLSVFPRNKIIRVESWDLIFNDFIKKGLQ